MVQRSALRQSRTGNIGPRTTDTAGRRRVLRRFSYAGLWHLSGCGHPLLRTRFLSLRVAQTPTNVSRLDLEESKHNVRQSGMSIV